MKVIIKTIGNQKFPLADVSSDSTVAVLKERIETELDIGGSVKKLILKGKVLKNDAATIAECGLEDDSELVCLVRKTPKRKKTPSKKTESSDQKENDVVPKPATQLPSAEAQKPREYTIAVEDVKKLCRMGFPEQLVVLSLKAAFGDATVATQYLLAGGIPPARAIALQKDMEELKAQAAKQALQQHQQQAAARPSGPQGMNPRFEACLSNPAMMAQILGNPVVQQQCLRMLAHEQPELHKRFMENPAEVGEDEAFQMAMFHILRKSFAAKAAKPQVRRIELTAEDKVALQRLQTEKAVPTMQQAAQIYMKHGKDLEKSMAFCDKLLERAKSVAASKQPEPVAASKQPEPARQPLNSRDNEANIAPPANTGAPTKPPSAALPPQETTLTISPDMLLDDDESDEE